jgi:hypothetical protein
MYSGHLTGRRASTFTSIRVSEAVAIPDLASSAGRRPQPHAGAFPRLRACQTPANCAIPSVISTNRGLGPNRRHHSH